MRTVDDTAKYCSDCGSGAIKQHTTSDRDQYRKLYDGKEWQRTRARVMGRDSICRHCDKALSSLVDHCVPAHEAVRQAQASGLWPYNPYAGFYLMCNLQGLCRACHATKTVEDAARVAAGYDWPDVVQAWKDKRIVQL